MPTSSAPTTLWAGCAAMPFSAGLGGGVAGWPGGATRSRRADRSSSCGVIHQLSVARCLAGVGVVASVPARNGRPAFRSGAGRFEEDLLHLVTA
jgi:hypothetical protein